MVKLLMSYFCTKRKKSFRNFMLNIKCECRAELNRDDIKFTSHRCTPFTGSDTGNVEVSLSSQLPLICDVRCRSTRVLSFGTKRLLVVYSVNFPFFHSHH